MWLLAIFLAAVSAQAEPFELVKVADGVYAAVARPAKPLNSNAAVIVNESDVVVVDSHGTPAAARALLRQIRKITPLPVRFVVNTHFHGDHVRGNAAYPGAVTIVSTQETRARVDDPAVVLPTLTFDRTVVLHRAKRDILVMFLGRGHTGGDAVVYLPREKVLVTGDLVSAWGPGMNDGFPHEWPATLDALAKLDITTVIGGHGPPGTKEMITRLRAYLVDLMAEVTAVVGRGGSEEEAQKVVADKVVPRHRGSFVAGELETRVPGNVKKVYQDIKAGRHR